MSKPWLDRLFKQKKLTPRQSEVMHLCFVGKSDVEIGKTLKVTFSTVRHHVNDSFKKLGINHRREILGIYAQRLGIETPKKRRRRRKKESSQPSRRGPGTINILQRLAQDPRRWTAKELSDELSIPRRDVHRFCKGLIESGEIERVKPGVYRKKRIGSLVERPVPRLHNPPPGTQFTGTVGYHGYQWSVKNSLLTDEQTKDLFEQVSLFRHHSWDALLRYPRIAPQLLELVPSKEVTPQLTRVAAVAHRNESRDQLVEFFLKHDPHGEALAQAVEYFQTWQFNLRKPRAGERLYAKVLQDVTEVWSNLNRVRMRLVETNLRLAVSYAKHYTCANLDVSDLINQATFGLIKAVDRFDLALGFKFSTYAGHWLRHEAGRTRANTGRTIRLPAHLQAKANEIFKQWVACEGDVDRIAKVVGKTSEQVERVVSAYNTVPLSLDAKPPNEEGRSLASVLLDDAPSAEELLYLQELGPVLRVHLDKLKPRIRDVIERRFGFNGYTVMTLQQIGELHGLSRERVRQLERDGLVTLRGAMGRETESRVVARKSRRRTERSPARRRS